MGSDEPKPASGSGRRTPRAVVVPFAVPEEGRDLGLGLAALVHAFSRIDGQNVALAQLLSRDSESSEPRPVEAFVLPQTWRDLAGAGAPHDDVSLVVTGQLDPPNDGRGALRVMAFDPKTGTVRVDVDATLTEDGVGEEIARVLDEVATAVDGDIGLVRDIGGLAWEALESVLLAERSVLHNPLRGGPHDRFAALLHLGRAVSDAPEAEFPAGRLAAVSLDVVLANPDDTRLAAFAERALERAVVDAPEHVAFYEALGALQVRRGALDSAEDYVHRALGQDSARPRLHALLAEARRARGDFDGAFVALEVGLSVLPDDPLLLTERAVTYLERGDPARASTALTEVLDAFPGYPPAFLTLLGCATRLADGSLVERLAFEAAANQNVPSEVARRVLRLFASTQSEGPESAMWSRTATGKVLHTARERAECMVCLATRLVSEGTDAWAELTLARGRVGLGELDAAREHLAKVELLAPATALAAEACRTRFAIEQPRAARELENVVRAAHAPSKDDDLDALSARAKLLAVDNDVWTAHFALGMAEGRRERWQEARVALETAVERSPGATPAHIELVAVHVALGSTQKALEHADRACALEGETARTLAVRATALLAASRHADARETIDRALALDASEANRALSERIRASSEPQGAFARLREALGLRKKLRS
jgi:tetratricopeptide (TPR) repeat protein